PALWRAGLRGRDGGRHRRDPVKVRRAQGDPGLHRGELHAVHGVHHRLPRHGASQHGPGCQHRPEDRRQQLRHRRGGPACVRRRTGRARGPCPGEDERVGQAEVQGAVRGHHPRGGVRPGVRLGEGPVAADRDHSQAADGLRKRPGHLPVARGEGARKRRALLHLRVGPVQGLRGMRPGLRRPRRAAHDPRDGGAERGADDGPGLLPPAAGHAAALPRPLQRRRGGGLARGRAAQPPDGPAQLRGPRVGRRGVRRLRRKERPALAGERDGGVHAPDLPPQGRPPPADRREKEGAGRLAALKARSPDEHQLCRNSFAHLVADLGGENDADSAARLADYEAEHGPITDEQVVGGLAAVLHREAFNHKDLQAVDGRRANGMSVMMMGASTGCNTVYGSTPPSNPHPYPWMNSLFQDGATISWLMAESVIIGHARRSVAPERMADALLDRSAAVASDAEYFTLTHLDDALMTEQEIRELPKVWVIGGDGALGDIGFQNVSKVVLQNRPNVKILMLDTQVYSNTGGQNSDSSTMLGGYDMNQFGVASQGKLIEKKNVAEAFTSGHGSPFVAQVSMANAAKLYK